MKIAGVFFGLWRLAPLNEHPFAYIDADIQSRRSGPLTLLHHRCKRMTYCGPSPAEISRDRIPQAPITTCPSFSRRTGLELRCERTVEDQQQVSAAFLSTYLISVNGLSLRIRKVFKISICGSVSQRDLRYRPTSTEVRVLEFASFYHTSQTIARILRPRTILSSDVLFPTTSTIKPQVSNRLIDYLCKRSQQPHKTKKHKTKSPRMADYSKLKVTDLKAELSRRGIPQTGLRLKQQIIDRLLEDDASGQNAPADTAETEAAEAQAEAPIEAPVDDAAPEQKEQPIEKEAEPEAAKDKQDEEEAKAGTAEAPGEPVATAAQDEQEPEDDITEASPAPKPAAEDRPEPQDQSHMEARQEPIAAIPAPPSVDSTANSTPAPHIKLGTDTPMSENMTQEVVEDSKKRKRRSRTPPPSTEEVKQKRARADNQSPTAIEKNVGGEVAMSEVPAVQVQEKIAQVEEEGQSKTEGADVPHPGPVKEESKQAGERNESDSLSHKTAPSDARFKGLFNKPAKTQDPSIETTVSTVDDEPDRDVTPSVHVATSTLYIRDFMRPLNPAGLRSHLVALATPPSSSTDPEIIKTFYLDHIKTHAFVTFSNISAASRVRNRLHDRVWPEERTRKPLWVDFVPEDQVSEWIATEQSSGSTGRSAGGKRFEIHYDQDNDGNVTTELIEAGTGGSASGPRRGSTIQTQPPSVAGARDLFSADTKTTTTQAPPPAAPRPDTQPATGFKPLDTLFLSTTTAKPKLYYLPVDKSISEKRLDAFDDLAKSRGGAGGNAGEELRRYTFEDEDLFVDKGADGVVARAPRRGGGGGGFGGRGGGRGGWGGGGRGGGNWRGGNRW